MGDDLLDGVDLTAEQRSQIAENKARRGPAGTLPKTANRGVSRSPRRGAQEEAGGQVDNSLFSGERSRR